MLFLYPQLSAQHSESDGNNNYKNNKGLDKDGKGFITKGDGARAVMNRREEYLYE